MHVLDDGEAARVRAVCEVLVPGCERVGAEVYVDALLARMGEAERAGTLAAFTAVAEPAARGVEALREIQFTPEFQLVRAMACEAFYSDFVAPGRDAAGAWSEIGFAPPLAARLNKDWSYLGVER